MFGKNPQLFFPRARIRFIRYTHFSRNPKIAEFLKAYNFVKEYGEGVNRMCNELEIVGLRVPEYHCNAFILQTIIFNAKVAISGEKLPEIAEKLAVDNEKLAIEGKKLAIEHVKLAIEKQKYKKPTQKNIFQIYENIDANQVFGSSEIKKILECSSANARIIMSKLREMNIVCEVKGKGKGKYRFLNEDETDGLY